MNVSKIFGATFFSVLAALVLYDLVGKGLLSKLGVSSYDDTFNPLGDNAKRDYVIHDGIVYRVHKSA
jgi:hypothetical protein